MKEKKVSKFSWVWPFIVFSYLVFLGVFLIYYQVRVHKLERQVINLEANIDDLCDDLDDEFMFIENDIAELNKRIDELEDELKNQQELWLNK